MERQHFRTTLRAGAHTLVADEPASLGGTDTGPSPAELLELALASCTAITLRMYADRKGWPLEQVDVKVSRTRLPSGGTHLDRTVTLVGALDATMRERLLQVANACPIHKVLTSPIEVATTLT